MRSTFQSVQVNCVSLTASWRRLIHGIALMTVVWAFWAFSPCGVAATDLAVTVVDQPDPVGVGNNVIYTVSITNRGPSNATEVTLTNLLPSRLAFVSYLSTQGSCGNAGGLVT